jgi:hypothetical protein
MQEDTSRSRADDATRHTFDDENVERAHEEALLPEVDAAITADDDSSGDELPTEEGTRAEPGAPLQWNLRRRWQRHQQQQQERERSYPENGAGYTVAHHERHSDDDGRTIEDASDDDGDSMNSAGVREDGESSGHPRSKHIHTAGNGDDYADKADEGADEYESDVDRLDDLNGFAGGGAEPYAHLGTISVGSSVEMMGPDECESWARVWFSGTVRALSFTGKHGRLRLEVQCDSGGEPVTYELRGAMLASKPATETDGDTTCKDTNRDESECEEQSGCQSAVLPAQPTRKFPGGSICVNVHNRVRPLPPPLKCKEASWTPSQHEVVEAKQSSGGWAGAVVRSDGLHEQQQTYGGNSDNVELSVRFTDATKRGDITVKLKDLRPAAEWMGPANGWRRAPGTRKAVTEAVRQRLGPLHPTVTTPSNLATLMSLGMKRRRWAQQQQQQQQQQVLQQHDKEFGRRRQQRKKIDGDTDGQTSQGRVDLHDPDGGINDAEAQRIEPEDVVNEHELPKTALGSGVIEPGTQVEWLDLHNDIGCWKPGRVEVAEFVEGERARVTVRLETSGPSTMTFLLGTSAKEAGTGRIILPKQPRRALPNSYLKYDRANRVRPAYPAGRLAKFEPIYWASVEVRTRKGWQPGFIRESLRDGRAEVRFPDVKATESHRLTDLRCALEWSGPEVGWMRAPAARLDACRALVLPFDVPSGLYVAPKHQRLLPKAEEEQQEQQEPQTPNKRARKEQKVNQDGVRGSDAERNEESNEHTKKRRKKMAHVQQNAFIGRPDQSTKEVTRICRRLAELDEPIVQDDDVNEASDQHQHRAPGESLGKEPESERPGDAELYVGKEVEMFELGTNVQGRWRLGVVESIEMRREKEEDEQQQQQQQQQQEQQEEEDGEGNEYEEERHRGEDESVWQGARSSPVHTTMHTVRVCDKRTGKLRAILLPLIEPNQPGNPLLAAQIMRRYCRVSFDVRKQYLLRPVPPPSHKGWQPQQYEPVECWVQGGWWSGWIERDEGSAKRIRLPDLCATLLASSTEQLRPAYVWHGPEAGFKRARAVLKSVSEAIVSAPALSMQDHASRKRKPRGVDFGGMPIGSNENTSRKTYEVSFDDFWASSIRGAESILSEPPKGCDSSHAKKLPTDSMSSELLRSEAASYVAERWEQLRYEVPEHKRERYTEYEQLKGHDVMLAEQALYEVVHRNKVTLSAASVSASSVFDDALAYIRSRSTRGSAASHSGGRRLQSPSIGQARPTPRPAVSAEQLTASSYALCKPKLEYRQQHAWPLCIEFTEACEAQGRRWCYMLLGMRDGCVHAWSLEAPNLTLQYLNFFKAHSDSPVMAMSRVRNSSSMVVTGSAAGEVRLWQLNGFNPDTVPSATRVETPVPLQQQSEQERQRLDLPSPSESLPLSPVTALTALYSISASLIAVGICTTHGCLTELT